MDDDKKADLSSIVDLASRPEPVTVLEVARALDISEATARRRLASLSHTHLVRIGGGPTTAYQMRYFRRVWQRADLVNREDAAWRELEPELVRLARFAAQELQTINYAVTEMLNNASDHSGAASVVLTAEIVGFAVEIVVFDDGVGVFENVKRAHGIATVADAVLQLEKGKLTSAPSAHSGEGLFFTAKCTQRFQLASGEHEWWVEGMRSIVAGASERVHGTRVRMTFVPGEVKRQVDVFNAFSSPKGGFHATRITVRLAQHGDSLISRSEAKRVVFGLEKFKHVTLDFAGVTAVGQGFVDEVFRVFASAHPQVTFRAVDAVDDVAFMLGRAGVKPNNVSTVDAGEQSNATDTLRGEIARAIEPALALARASSRVDIVVLLEAALRAARV